MSAFVGTYDPGVFNVKSIKEARGVVLTEDVHMSTDERWERETPYLANLMRCLDITEKSVVLDYGCGIGRMSRALIENFGCRVVGVDISIGMRALAAHYVGHPRFMACDPRMLDDLDIKVDAAISVWVLQHCVKPEVDIARIKRSLKDGSKFFVVNTTQRVVPTKEELWIDDGVNVRGLLEGSFNCLSVEKMDKDLVSPIMHERTFIGLFQKAK